ncbi:marine proteobacterial sortase target protein [Enterovibrio coralii]|uniref:Alpha-1-antitrypsin n=1 Tax=Enterovibrio coralii TaxID=294935 RepID=A0A135I598_9GAMM|nr:marine proteobacterial sortase target protein [Enterovibrio coralii]KXF80620.1 alpha-1-antitrypsin [Enterovibrio coralii]
MYSFKVLRVRIIGSLADWSLAIVMAFIMCGSVQATEQEKGLFIQSTDEPESVWTEAPQLSTETNMVINGIVNRAEVTQTFTNPTEEWVNARYVFPLPQEAAVDRLFIRVGERVIEGEIQPKKKARESFNQAAREGMRASLVEQHRSNLFSTAVANVGPRETIEVTIEYQELVTYEDGEFSLRFPTTFTHRYIPSRGAAPLISESNAPLLKLQNGWAVANTRVPDANEITPNQRAPLLEDPISFDLSIDINMGLPIENIDSDSASLNITEISPTRFGVTLSEVDIANRDFELTWSPVSDSAPTAAMFVEEKNAEQFGLLMVVPPTELSSSVLNKNTTFVIDVSGSMYGEAMEQAKEAVIYGLNRLSASDHFNIVYFNDQAFRLSPQPLPASLSNIAKATQLVRQLQADGGTEMLNAVDVAFDIPTMESALNQIIFITDGAIANEAELYAAISNGLGSRRLFTVGIGSAPNSGFMQRAAITGKGTFTHIGNLRQVSKQLELLFQKLSRPAMQDIVMNWQDGSNVDAWPSPIPDLYSEQPLVQVFKVADGKNALVINGKLGGQTWTQVVDLSSVQPSKGTGLDVLWARKQIESIALNPNLDTAVKVQKITDLGLAHHIVTQHTSLVAIDKTPNRPRDIAPQSHEIKPMPPKGSGMMIQSGLGSDRSIILGAILLMLSVIGFKVFSKTSDSAKNKCIQEGVAQ